MTATPIDLNDAGLAPVRHDLAEVRRRLADTAKEWLPALFPNARRAPDGRTLRCADLSGRAPRGEGSCVIHLEGRFAGWGFDHATGESAGPIDMVYHATGAPEPRLFDEAARLARMDSPAPPARAAEPRPDHSHEVARILAGCAPLAGSPAEAYLSGRGLAPPDSPDLLFHPDLADFESRRGWPGMVAIVRDAAGEPTGGIHRTYLLDDGSGKAPPGKKMLGPVAGGAVRLAPTREDGRIGVAEGIETALAAMALFGVATMAALSADGLRRWQWPEGTRHVTIFADAGHAGMQAAATLADRLNVADIPSRIVAPLHGDDFNDDLRRGATAADYEQAAGGEPKAPATAAAPATVEELLAAASSLTRPPDSEPLADLLGRLALARLDPLPERQVLAAVKTATGIAVSILEKQLVELRRRVNATGDVRRAPVRPPWASLLRIDAGGAPERNEANVITALSLDAAFTGALMFDEFSQEIIVARALPWDPAGTVHLRPWGEADDVRCAEWLQRHEINVPPVVVGRSVVAVSRNIRIHPVRDYLEALAWDGTSRLDTWAVAYLGAEDTPLHRSMAALWMVSAVARIMQPGCKADHMLILEGPQGIRKSTALKVLASEPWFTDELAELGSKDAAQQMRGIWIIEMAELDAIGQADVSRIKAFLSRTTDRYRPPYERYVVTVPRQCVFAGTVNPDTYLRDETGNRRFWPLRCGDIDLEGLRRDRDQLWAEAVARYRAGAPWWIEDRALVAEASAAQEARYQGDAWDARIERWLVSERKPVNVGVGHFEDWQERFVPRAKPLTDVSIGEVLEQALGIEAAKWTKGDQMRVGAYLKAKKWERYKTTGSAKDGVAREWRYRRPSPSEEGA
ncbi:P-loop ATPase [Roseomonas alkaliterrae]|uniref:Putative P-loop ATPase n=1 Tax=Neoroseomonas alkaliterrae TaxID=1452450 RepID=A0A840YCP4_9PROT|nr:VapE domain-containing protein [Neoroseomonas alkaliterrae]MBB5691713.1 putative P-loop ATPase [Neoroseomonas alkaliterrae]MBR0676373.1 P-loop ATPase [Neoroseomonas alkaliterrae]